MLLRINVNEFDFVNYPNATKLLALDCRTRKQLLLSLVEEGLKKYNVLPYDKKSAEALLIMLDSTREDGSSNKGINTNIHSFSSGSKAVVANKKAAKSKSKSKSKGADVQNGNDDANAPVVQDTTVRFDAIDVRGESVQQAATATNNPGNNAQAVKATEEVAYEDDTPMTEAELFASLGIDMSDIL